MAIVSCAYRGDGISGAVHGATCALLLGEGTVSLPVTLLTFDDAASAAWSKREVAFVFFASVIGFCLGPNVSRIVSVI